MSYFFFCYSCGLAVLAMAARPLCTDDVAVDGDVNIGGDTDDKLEETSNLKKLDVYIKRLKCSLYKYHSCLLYAQVGK